MKNLSTIISFFVLSFILHGCAPISKTVDDETGIVSKSGIVNSKDHYSLMLRRRYDPKDSLCFTLMLHAASKGLLPDSLLATTGTFVLTLTNGEKIEIHGVKGENNPLGFGPAIGFTGKTTEIVMKSVMENPIKEIGAFGILETRFSNGQQEKQKEILKSLLNEESKNSGQSSKQPRF